MRTIDLSFFYIASRRICIEEKMEAYAVADDIKPLLGNIGESLSNTTINLAIASATDEINTRTNRIPPNDWQTTDHNFDWIKQLARYLAAMQLSIGINDFNESREFMRREINRIFEIVSQTDQGTNTDFVESSEASTYAMNPNGIIWSTRYPGLKKRPVIANQQYSFLRDIGG